MTTEIAAGFWPCKVLDGFYGDNDKNIPVVRINVELTEGPFKGMRQTYEEAVNNKQAPYIARTCKAVGWKCQSLSTLKIDVAEWVKTTGGESTLEIRHVPITKGKRAGSIWAKPNSIGRGPKPLRESSQENLYDADAAMRAALADDAAGNAAGNQDNNGTPPPDDAPPPSDDDIPFATISPLADRDPITRSWL
jgi:hypothetical protein